MDTYILRIYRRGPAASRALHGTVERVGARARSAFASRDELWALLEAPAASAGRAARPADLDQQHDDGGSDVTPES